MKAKYPGPDKDGNVNYQNALRMGGNSTPLSGPIILEIKLCITLRIIAGGQQLDMIWYGAQKDTIDSIFLFTLDLFAAAISDAESFNFDPNLEGFSDECARMAHEWSEIQMKKIGCTPNEGTIGVTDGFVVAIQAPSAKDREGAPLADYWNYKSCYALIAQIMCDAFTRIRVCDVRCPGSTPDLTAYHQTDLYRWYIEGRFESKYHTMLDEAYSSIGGDFHLTPFSRSQLRKAKSKSVTLYCKMKVFNNNQSGQRITVERALGMTVRKCGILWRPLEYSLAVNTLIIKTCAKIHNIAVAAWKKRGKKAEEIAAMDKAYLAKKEAGLNMGFKPSNGPSDRAVADLSQASDEDIALLMSNLEVPLNASGLPLSAKKKCATSRNYE